MTHALLLESDSCPAAAPCPADVAVQIESDKVAAVKRELADVDAQLARTERLLKIADPDGSELAAALLICFVLS